MRLLLSFILLFPALSPVGLAAEPVTLFVSIPPIKTFVEKIGGEHVKVHSMVPATHSPATYNPSPKQIAMLSQARLYVRVGVPFEDSWMKRIYAAAPNMRIIDARSNIQLQEMAAHDHGPTEHGHNEHEHHDHTAHQEDALDPHIWTSPIIVKQILVNITKALSRESPAHKATFEQNRQDYSARLDALDGFIRSKTATMQHPEFMVFHPAWGYFARQYGLEQIVIEKEGKQPGPRGLAKLIEQAREHNIKTVFIQPQFSRLSAQQIAKAIGGKVIAVDPLSADYINSMRTMALALSGQ